MHIVALLLSCAACASFGRRSRRPVKEAQSNPLGLEMRLLSAGTPEAAFMYSSPEFHTRARRPADALALAYANLQPVTRKQMGRISLPWDATRVQASAMKTQLEMMAAVTASRFVRVATERELRLAIKTHATLQWHESMSMACGQLGEVTSVDPSDGTSQVQFYSPIFAKFWLPSSLLHDEESAVAAAELIEDASAKQATPAEASGGADGQRIVAGRSTDGRFPGQGHRFKIGRGTKKVRQVFRQ